ncbi:hypothetical protein FRC01_013974, partial [Tulasnella sp. 417]
MSTTDNSLPVPASRRTLYNSQQPIRVLPPIRFSFSVGEPPESIGQSTAIEAPGPLRLG